MFVKIYFSAPSMLKVLAAVLTVAVSNANAAVVVDDVALVARLPQYAQVAPQPRSFTVATGGRYAVTLTDIGFPIGSTLLSVDVIITKGAQTTGRISRLGTQEFDATPGTYTIHVLGNGAPAGLATVGISIASVSGGVPLLQYQSGLSGNPIPAPSNRSSLAARFTVATAGTYQVAVNDRGFPAPLSSYDLLVVSTAGTPVARLCQPAIPSVCGSAPLSFTAAAGSYDLFANAAAAGPLDAGLYSINVTGMPGGVLYAATHPVGVLESHAFIEFPSAGSYSLTLNDLQFPVALTSVRAVVAQGSDVLTNVSGPTTQAFNAAQGQAALYTMAAPTGSQGVGTFGVHVPNGTQTLYSDAKAVVATSAVDGVRAYVFVGTFPAAGNYRIQARDFGFPTTIPALQVIATQDGARLGLGAVSAGGSLTVPARAGPFMILAIANVFSSNATGLFGITIDAQPSGVEVLTVTQGIGDLFHARTLTATNAGLMNVSLRDVGFPMPFEELALVVTRGNNMVGQIFGGGTFSFAATPGAYSLNFIARSRPIDHYGLYGLTVEDGVAPRVSFSASSISLPAKATTTVSWAAAGATSCVASGGWSGARPTTGSNVSVGPFSANTTLTLTCVGDGGTHSASVSIVVVPDTSIPSTPPESGGGGGMAIWQLLAALLLCLRGTFTARKDAFPFCMLRVRLVSLMRLSHYRFSLGKR